MTKIYRKLTVEFMHKVHVYEQRLNSILLNLA